MWEFAVPVLFVTIWRDTFMPGAIFSFLLYLACIFAMPRLGSWVNSKTMLRIDILRRVIHLQNIFTLLILLSFYCVYAFSDAGDDDRNEIWNLKSGLFFCALVIFGVGGELMSRTETIAIEKDWVPQLLKNDGADNLAKTNACMRRIDLLCKLLAPVVFGCALDVISGETAKIVGGLIFVGVFNAMSYPAELWAVTHVYEMSAALQRSPSVVAAALDDDDSKSAELLANENIQGDNVTEDRSLSYPQRLRRFIAFNSALWLEFWRHPLFWASVAYGMLYATVLSHGSLMTQYLVSSDASISLTVIGIFRGAGAVLGIAGTFVYPRLRHVCNGSLRRVGQLSIGAFALTIASSVIVFDTGTNETARDYLLMSAVSLARAPLWVFDLDITQLLQSEVTHAKRGLVSGCHVSMYTLFSIIINILSIVFHRPANFPTLVHISVIFVGLGALIFNVWGSCAPSADTKTSTDDGKRVHFVALRDVDAGDSDIGRSRGERNHSNDDADDGSGLVSL
eukprot:g2959.t1